LSVTDSTGSAGVGGRPSPAGGPTAAGNDIALTTFTPLAWWGFYLPALLRFVQATGATLAPLEQLSFINAAQWSIVARFPPNGPPQGPDPARWPQMIFESNFNGTWEQYIDAFAEVMTLNFKAFWGPSPKFPGPMPTGPFKAWIRAHETEATHYYCAYPSATATTITSALALEEALSRFARDSAGMDAASFQDAYNHLLTEVQRDL
jgi:hypothetical protein